MIFPRWRRFVRRNRRPKPFGKSGLAGICEKSIHRGRLCPRGLHSLPYKRGRLWDLSQDTARVVTDARASCRWINVVKEKRGCGVAGELLSKISAWFVEQKAFRICVDVDLKNAAARNLYAKYGARPLNEHWMVWENVI